MTATGVSLRPSNLNKKTSDNFGEAVFGLNNKLIDDAIDKAADRIGDWVKEKYDQDLVSLLLDKIVDRISEDEKWRTLIFESLVEAILSAVKTGRDDGE